MKVLIKNCLGEVDFLKRNETEFRMNFAATQQYNLASKVTKFDFAAITSIFNQFWIGQRIWTSNFMTNFKKIIIDLTLHKQKMPRGYPIYPLKGSF